VRALAPFIAGSSGLRYRAFAPYSILGTGLWSAAFTLIGYFAAQSLDEVAHVAGRGTFLFGVTVAVIVAVVVTVRYLREPENRERLVREMERRRALRPLVALGRRVKPQALFIWNRLTPGELGLELTTTIAVLAVAAFVFVGYAILLEGEPGPTPGDSTALDVVRDINEPWFTDVNRAVTRLGAPYVAYPVAAVVVVALAFQRRFAAAAVVVFAMLIVFIAVDLLKEMVDRPRPPDRLAPTEQSSYPSGHAAYSVLYVWAAGIVAIRLGGQRLGTRLTAGGLVLVLGILLAAAIGLSRAYLRVHYLSDVNGGWGLGVAAFALCAAVAIIVTHLRQNAPSRRGEVSPVGEDRA
jgi:membrane-associated phospholipid phosphatase